MTNKFDAKAQARLVSKLLRMSDEASTRSGGAILAQRLADYTSDELRGLTEEQLLSVLSIVDDNAAKNLLRDGNGEIHGFAYSRAVYVPLRHDADSHEATSRRDNTARSKATARGKATPRRRAKAKHTTASGSKTTTPRKAPAGRKASGKGR